MVGALAAFGLVVAVRDLCMASVTASVLFLLFAQVLINRDDVGRPVAGPDLDADHDAVIAQARDAA